MTRVLLTTAALALLATGTFAQSRANILPVPGVKHAGTYHVATGTWTRGRPSPARVDYQVIYDNTCSGAWYTTLEQQTFHDDGRLPSSTSPQTDQDAFGSGTWASTSFCGEDSYEIHLYQFAYCSGVAAPVTALSLFYECYTACSDATLITPTLALQVSGLPGSPTPGTAVGCWTVDIDLLGATLHFDMQGDCDGSWDGSPALDNFGYAYMQVTPDPATLSGPILAGDPDGLLLDGPGGTGCCVGCGTVLWYGTNVPGVNTEGSGLNTQDFFEKDDHLGGLAFVMNGCYWFGGYSATAPHSDIHLEILGSAWVGGPLENIVFCFGSLASGNPCPCGNDNPGLPNGCANGTYPEGAHLDFSGQSSLTADTLVLHGTFGQPNNSGMFFQALNELDGAIVFLGDGMRCAGGFLKRLKVKLNDATGAADSLGTVISARSAQLGDVLAPGDIRYYQWWYRDNVNPPCGLGVNDSNSSNGVRITWLP